MTLKHAFNVFSQYSVEEEHPTYQIGIEESMNVEIHPLALSSGKETPSYIKMELWPRQSSGKQFKWRFTSRKVSVPWCKTFEGIIGTEE